MMYDMPFSHFSYVTSERSLHMSVKETWPGEEVFVIGGSFMGQCRYMAYHTESGGDGMRSGRRWVTPYMDAGPPFRAAVKNLF